MVRGCRGRNCRRRKRVRARARGGRERGSGTRTHLAQLPHVGDARAHDVEPPRRPMLHRAVLAEALLLGARRALLASQPAARAESRPGCDARRDGRRRRLARRTSSSSSRTCSGSRRPSARAERVLLVEICRRRRRRSEGRRGEVARLLPQRRLERRAADACAHVAGEAVLLLTLEPEGLEPLECGPERRRRREVEDGRSRGALLEGCRRRRRRVRRGRDGGGRWSGARAGEEVGGVGEGRAGEERGEEREVRRRRVPFGVAVRVGRG